MEATLPLFFRALMQTYGLQDIPSLLDAAIYAGAEWVVAEQDFPSMGKSTLESAKMSIDYLLKL